MHPFWTLRLPLLTTWLVFVVTQLAWYLWTIPTTFQCEHTPYRFVSSIGGGTMTRFACLSPEFDVPCHTSSIAKGWGYTRCRSFVQRPVKIVDEQFLMQKKCEADLGQLATYYPGEGCGCHLPFGRLVDDSYCAWRDLYCQRTHGSGAVVVDPDGAWDFSCDCQPPLRMDPETGKCVP